MTHIYSNKDVDLYTGDNISLIKGLADSSVHLTVTSPPYDGLRDYETETGWSFEKFCTLADELYRITTDGGVVVWNVCDQTINGSETGSSFRQALRMMDAGFNLADTMIYQKANPGGARGSNKTYIQCFEYMFVFSKGTLKTTNLIKDRKNVRSGASKGGGKRNKDGTVGATTIVDSGEYGRRFNVWTYPTQTDEYSAKHPAPFPLKMAEDHIASWTNEGDTVFDPFSGSGTTALAALKSRRKAIGFDISEEYTEIAIQRISAEIKGMETLSLFGLT